MTTAALPRAIGYVENGTSFNFPITFPFRQNADIRAERQIQGVTLPLAPGTDFFVTGAGDAAGGTLTLAATVAGARLSIWSETARGQQTDYDVNDTFPAEGHEGALDRLDLVTQDIDRELARTARVPRGEPGFLLPSLPARAGRVMSFDAAGKPLMLSPEEFSAPSAEARAWALEAKIAAELAEAFSGPAFASIGDGLAATAEGKFFAVRSGDGELSVEPVEGGFAVSAGDVTFTVYRKVNGAATEARQVVTTTALGSANGAGFIGVRQAGDGAITRTAQAKLLETVSITDYLGALAPAAALQAAIDHVASVGGGEVLLPRGTYTVTMANTAPDGIGNDYDGYLSGADAQFGATLKYAVQMRSNVTLRGEGATIKVADGQSTDAAPQNWCVFYSHEPLENIAFIGLTIDLNGQNNPFSPNRANTGLSLERRYGRKHHAVIMFEGVRGRADDVLIRECTFKNGAGISTIVAGRVAPNLRPDGSSGMGRRWRILDCDFINNGLDTYDHSSLFLWCEYVQVRGCNFDNSAVYAPTAENRTGMAGAIETHGAHTLIEGNTIVNCRRGVFVSENGSLGLHAGPAGYPVSNVIIRDNIIRVAKFGGIDLFFGGVAGVAAPHRISILDNEIVMTGDDTNESPTDFPSAIIMNGDGTTLSAIEYLEIVGNRATRDISVSGRSSHFATLSLQAANFKSLTIQDNESSGFTRGVYIVTMAAWNADAAEYKAGQQVLHEGSIYAAIATHEPGVFAADLSEGRWVLVSSGSLLCDDLALVDNSWRNPAGGTLPNVPEGQKAGIFLLAQGGSIGRLLVDDEVIDTSDALRWESGIAVAETAPTIVAHFEVARTARFDRRFDPADTMIGVSDLTLTRLLGVPVAAVYPAGTIAGHGVGTQPVTIPGVTAGDVLEVVGFAPGNADSLSWGARFTAADNARLRVVNDTASGVDPGTTPFAVVAHAR